MTDDTMRSIASDAQWGDDDFDLDVRLSPVKSRERMAAGEDTSDSCDHSCVRSCNGSCDTCGTNCRPDCR